MTWRVPPGFPKHCGRGGNVCDSRSWLILEKKPSWDATVGFSMLPMFATWLNPFLPPPAMQRMMIPCRRSSHFRDQLSRKGIRLLVVPMPVKPSVYPDKLTRRVASGGQSFSSHTLELISKLKAAGVEVSNLFETFRGLREKNSLSESEPYYLVRDTHWSGKAVIIAAEEVAAQIRRLGWVDSGSTDYGLKAVIVKRRSDVAQMVKMPGIEEKYPPEDVLCYQVVQETDSKPYQDDPHSPVLVLGDSFLRIYQTDEPTSAGFVAHLAMKLRRPLASIVNDGGASTLVRQELARRAGAPARQTARDLGVCGARHPIRYGGLERGFLAVSCDTIVPLG